MRLDYRVPEFSVSIGGWDATEYVDSLELSQDYPDRGSPLYWKGRIELSLNVRALWAGLTDADFSPYSNPSRWRPCQALVSIAIAGYNLPAMRIRQYVYDPVKRVGQAELYQLLEAAATSIEGKEIDKPIGQDGCRLGVLVEKLLDAAFEDCSIQPDYDLLPLTGYHDPPFASNNPIQEAQEFCFSNYHWLWMDKDEKVRSASGDPQENSVIFRRSLGQVELEPDPENINFASDRVILTGGKQVGWKPSKIEVKDADEDQEDSFDDDGMERIIETKSYARKSDLYPEKYSASPADPNFDTSDVLAEIKTIRKFYWGIDPEVEAIPTPPVATQPSPQVSDYADQYEHGDLVQTITEIQQTRGQVFPDDYPGDTSFVLAVKTIETKFAKVGYQPRGALTPDAYPGDTTLAVSSLEILTKGKVEPDGKIPGKKDPATGDTKRLEKEIKKVWRVSTTPWQFYDQPYSSELELEQNGWTPIKPQRYTEDVGFVPSQEHLDYLAVQTANREIARRDAVKVTMPVPIEWLATNGAPMNRCQIHDGEYQIENPVITIADRACEFSFTGIRLGTIPTVPDPPEPAPYIPTGALQLLPVGHIAQAIGSPIVPSPFGAIGGTAPYSYSATSFLPSGLSLSSGGVLSGTPTEAFTGTKTIQATDSLGATATASLSLDIVDVEVVASHSIAGSLMSAIVLELEISGVILQQFDTPVVFEIDVGDPVSTSTIVTSGGDTVTSGGDTVIYGGS